MLRGDIISVKKDGFDHVGLCAGVANGVDYVVHNSRAQGLVVLDTLVDFAAGQRFTLVSVGGDATAVDRALSFLGKKYDLFAFNCEHAVSLAKTGVPTSPQLQKALARSGIAAVVLAGLGLAYAHYRPSFDSSVGANGGFRKSNGRFAKAPIL